MRAATSSAPDISCDHCRHAIEKAVGALPGVADVLVFVESKRAIGLFNPEEVSMERIGGAMDQEGYPVTGCKGEPAPA